MEAMQSYETCHRVELTWDEGKNKKNVETRFSNGVGFVAKRGTHCVHLTVNVSEYVTSAKVTSKPFNSSFNL